MSLMIRNEMKYNLHYGEVQTRFSKGWLQCQTRIHTEQNRNKVPQGAATTPYEKRTTRDHRIRMVKSYIHAYSFRDEQYHHENMLI